MATGKGAADAGIEHLRIGAGNAVADYTDDDIFVGQIGDILDIGEVRVGQRRNTVFGLDRADVVRPEKIGGETGVRSGKNDTETVKLDN